MHYTSIENIHKVIDPLFLDAYKEKFQSAMTEKVLRKRTEKLKALQDELAAGRYFDPAAGSGNFLTESYLSLRRLENDILRETITDDAGTGMLGFVEEELNPIKVSINQFYGIEINDFAVSVAKTAMWIAEAQMFRETEGIINREMDFLPLHTYLNIHEGNALRMDWKEVLEPSDSVRFLGNPPFIGYSNQLKAQKEDMLAIYVDENGKPYKTAGKIDYVAGWYFKTAQYMQNTNITAAFVSTNSITQGEQVASVWQPLYERFGISINFAYRTFRWDSESQQKAHVHVVIIGFSAATSVCRTNWLYTDSTPHQAVNISPYLVDGPTVFVKPCRCQPEGIPAMKTGNRPADGGNLIIEAADYAEFIRKDPESVKYIKHFMGSREFINRLDRYCLWLVDASPSELQKMPQVRARIEACRENRLNAPDAGRRKLADTPAVFRETMNPKQFLIVPEVSSERRRYIPIGFADNSVIASNLLFIVPDAELYHFGVLQSNVHMAWMRAVAGRLEMRYRYSRDIVYNTFPWPALTDKQKCVIERTAQSILDVREKYSQDSYAALYDDTLMPAELRAAHRANDKAVMQAYGFWGKLNSESACVAELMKMYEELSRKVVK